MNSSEKVRNWLSNWNSVGTESAGRVEVCAGVERLATLRTRHPEEE